MNANKTKCPYCAHGVKGGAWGVYSHIKAKHPQKKRAHLKPKRAGDDEQSMADLMIEAQLNRAMGIKNDDWIEDMIP